jgi:hypothetical protein
MRRTPGAVNGKASVGPVKVGGDWAQRNLMARATRGAENQFSRSCDTCPVVGIGEFNQS